MLDLRPNCECCNANLPPHSTQARICSFECTFCATCTDTILKAKCPNCGGTLTERPIRPPNHLQRHPASTKRILRDQPCEAAP